MTRFAVIVIALWMLGGGVAHLFAPQAFYPIVPDIFPQGPSVILSGLFEIALGVAVINRRTRPLAGLLFTIWCAVLLPLHLWDFFRPDPIFSPWYVAATRVVIQFGLIALGLYLWRGRPRTT